MLCTGLKHLILKVLNKMLKHVWIDLGNHKSIRFIVFTMAVCEWLNNYKIVCKNKVVILIDVSNTMLYN